MTTPHRLMLEVGVEGDRFRPHPENQRCVDAGCVPADAHQRLRAAAAVVVFAWVHPTTGDGADVRAAVQALAAVLREETP